MTNPSTPTNTENLPSTAASRELEERGVIESPLQTLLDAVDPHERHLLAFFEPSGAGCAILGEGFDQAELVRTIVSHIRSEDPRISQKGIDQLTKLITQIATVNGRIGRTVTQVTQENTNGTKQVSRAEVQRFASPPRTHEGVPGSRTHLPTAD